MNKKIIEKIDVIRREFKVPTKGLYEFLKKNCPAEYMNSKFEPSEQWLSSARKYVQELMILEAWGKPEK